MILGLSYFYMIYLSIKLLNLNIIIENIVKKLSLDLYTFVCDWEEMKDLQLSFFKASVANCDIPQDHAFVAAVYMCAAKFGIKTILSGVNFATESVLPKAWGHSNTDLVYLEAIQKKFGTRSLKKYPKLGFFAYNFYYPYIKKIRSVRILDLVKYNKCEAKSELMSEFDWRDYGGKHYESRFTRFFQSYYLPVKFGYDKRRAHWSSLILSSQATREEALKDLAQSPFDASKVDVDLDFISKKLDIEKEMLKKILDRPGVKDEVFPNNKKWLALKLKLFGPLPE